MKSVRILSALALLLPAIAQAQYYAPVYGDYSRAMFTQTVMDRLGGARDGYNCFPDVRNQSYAPAVCAAKLQGIVKGGADGYFRPDTPVTFIEAATIALRADGYVAQSGSPWYRPYLEEMSRRDAIPSSVVNILNPITSAQANEIITEVFDGAEHDDDDDDDEKDDNDDDDLYLYITASDERVDVDDTVTFRIKIRNDDNDDLDDLDVRVTFDEDEFEYVSSSDSGDLEDDEEVTWENIDVDEDETYTLLLTLRVSDDNDEDDRIGIEAEVEDSEASKYITVEDDDNDDDDEAVRLTVTDSPDPVEPGDTIRYTIKIENREDDDIRVDIRAVLDPQVEFVSASDDGDEERDEVVWDDIRLDEDEEETVTLTVRVDDDADDGDTIRIEFTANDDEETETTRVDDDGDDDDDDDTGDEDIDVSITDSRDPARVGDEVEYRITLQNDEDDDVEIKVIAELDEGMSFLDASNGGDEEEDDEIHWDDIEIDEDDDRTITLRVRINNDADDGDTLRLKVRAGDGDDEETTRIDD